MPSDVCTATQEAKRQNSEGKLFPAYHLKKNLPLKKPSWEEGIASKWGSKIRKRKTGD